MLSQPDQQFGFSIPSQAKSYNSSSLSSSHNSSISLVPMLRGGSTAPTSQAPSECGSNSGHGTQDDPQLAPPRCLPQLCMLAATASQASGAPPRISRIHCPPSSQPSSNNDIQHQHSAWNENLPSAPPPPVKLCQMQTFAQLPSTISESHTILATDHHSEVDQDGLLIVDEVSPSEDDHFTELIVHGNGEYQ